jgi:serine protease inhibitor
MKKNAFQEESIQKIQAAREVPAPHINVEEVDLKRPERAHDGMLGKRIRKGVLIAVPVVLVTGIVVAGAMLVSGTTFETERSFRRNSESFSANVAKDIEASSFKSLNSITYPDGTQYRRREVSDAYKEGVLSFSNKIYQATKKKGNFGFAPLPLYLNLDLVSLGTQKENVREEFNALLGGDYTLRAANFRSAYLSDYFYQEQGTLQIYNGVFLDDGRPDLGKLTPNPDFVKEMSRRYCEAYQLDYQNPEDVARVASWANAKAGRDGFIDSRFLDVKPETAFQFVTTMYFNNQWASAFSTNDSYQAPFYGSTIQENVTYMQHTYRGAIYEYDKYVSVRDYYANLMSIQYLVPKSTQDNIFDLLGDADFLHDEESHRLKDSYAVELSVPKFTATAEADFTKCLKEKFLPSAFSRFGNPMDAIFNENEDKSFWLDFSKQKNAISFKEDGTEIVSVTVTSGYGEASAAPFDGTYQVNLNQPFVYCIYDSNGLPIYMGNVASI